MKKDRMKKSPQDNLSQIQCDWLYPTPNPLETFEDFVKFTHQDLEGMSTSELKKERARVEMRLLYDRRPGVWFSERLKAIKEAVRMLEIDKLKEIKIEVCESSEMTSTVRSVKRILEDQFRIWRAIQIQGEHFRIMQLNQAPLMSSLSGAFLSNIPL